MSNHNIIEHKSNYGSLKIEEDFIAICSKGQCSSHCKALILAVLEDRMNIQRSQGNGEFVHLTIPDWVICTYMLYKRNSIIDSLNELVTEKLIIRQSVLVRHQKTFEYTLNLEEIDVQLQALPDNIHTDEPEQDTSLPGNPRFQSQRSRIRRHNKRATLVGLPATLNNRQWLQTLEDFDYSCAFCKGLYDVLEHFVPLAHRSEGTTEYNCIPACCECNRIKRDTHPLLLPTDSPLSQTIPSIMRYLEIRKNNAEVER